MIVRAATIDDILRVCRNLRDVDAEEQFARRSDTSPDHLAADLIGLWRSVIGRYAICTDDGAAQCILAAYRAGEGVARVHRISTSVDVTRAVFSFGVRAFMPVVVQSAVQRAECSVLARHEVAGAMLQRLGFQPQGIDPRLGRGGEPFMNFAWVRESHRENWRPERHDVRI